MRLFTALSFLVFLFSFAPSPALSQPSPTTTPYGEQHIDEERGITITYFVLEKESGSVIYVMPPLTIGPMESSDREGADIRLIFPVEHEWPEDVLIDIVENIRRERSWWVRALPVKLFPNLGISGLLQLGGKDWNEETFNSRYLRMFQNSLVQEEEWKLYLRIPSSLLGAFKGSKEGDFTFTFHPFPNKPIPEISSTCWERLSIERPLGAIPNGSSIAFDVSSSASEAQAEHHGHP